VPAGRASMAGATGGSARHLSLRDGFTLLEILVVLAVFGLLLAGLSQGVRYGLRAWESQVRIAGRSGDLDAVDRALRHMIAVAEPGDDNDTAPFAATRDQLEFVTVLPDGGGTLPVRRVAATLLVDPAHRLVLRWRPWLHAEPLRPAPAMTETELLRGVSRLDLAFWQPRGGWTATWHAADLPALVRIRVIFPPADPRHWPDIVAAPVLDRP
jgi:general secretion pathway protein J